MSTRGPRSASGDRRGANALPRARPSRHDHGDALDTSIAGDDRPVTVEERPDVASLGAEPDPIKLIAGIAGVTAAISERTNDVYTVLVGAGRSDAAAAGLLEEIQQQRSDGQRGIARALHRRGSLRKGLRGQDAADLIHALMPPDVYRLLVVERGWSPARYKAWLPATLVQQLT